MPGVRYRLKLLEPVICSALEGEPNSAVSYDMIPGSVMRGVLIGQYMRKGNEITPGEGDPARLFFSDETLFRNATLVVNNQAGRVIPTTWKRRKRGGNKNEVRDTVFNPKGFGSEKSGTPKGYAAVADDHLYIKKPLPQINVHVQRRRRRKENGRYREGSPLPYRYDALAAGQVFEGYIQCQSQADAETLLNLLQVRRHLTLGGATNAGYGSVEIESAEIVEDTAVKIPSDDKVVVTLLSDCVLRDKWGEYEPSSTTIEAELGGEIDAKRSSLNTTLAGGFNRKWGLPLPQTPCLKAGSVIVLQAPDRERLAAAVETGLGERVNEGFGQIAVNWQSQKPYRLAKTETEKTTETIPKMEGHLQILWERIQRFAEFETDPVNHVFEAENPYPVRGGITRTQLQRLRNRIGDALRGSEETNYHKFMEEFFEEIAGKEADRQYEKTRIKGRILRDWLKDPDIQAGLSDRDKLRLVDAILERAAKEKGA